MSTHESIFKIKCTCKMLPVTICILVISKSNFWAKLQLVYVHLRIAINHIGSFFAYLYQLLASLRLRRERHHYRPLFLRWGLSLHPKLNSKRSDILIKCELYNSQILLWSKSWFLVFIWTGDTIKSYWLWDHTKFVFFTHVMPNWFYKSLFCIIFHLKLDVCWLHLPFIEFFQS